MSTIENSDIIFVLENGRIIEQRKHKELISLDGNMLHFINIQQYVKININIYFKLIFNVNFNWIFNIYILNDILFSFSLNIFIK